MWGVGHGIVVRMFAGWLFIYWHGCEVLLSATARNCVLLMIKRISILSIFVLVWKCSFCVQSILIGSTFLFAVCKVFRWVLEIVGTRPRQNWRMVVLFLIYCLSFPLLNEIPPCALSVFCLYINFECNVVYERAERHKGVVCNLQNFTLVCYRLCFLVSTDAPFAIVGHLCVHGFSTSKGTALCLLLTINSKINGNPKGV